MMEGKYFMDNGNIKKKIKKNVNKTGFVFEYEVTNLLENYDWQVINSRYYMDIEYKKAREIDIIAYKSKQIDKIRYYTVLIISCKKNEKSPFWVFYTKDINKNDPNINFYPIYNWTNHKGLKYMLENKKYKNLITNNFNKKYIKNIYDINNQIFAFQEFDNKGNPQNDKNIYNSIITVINAYEYEKKEFNN